MFIRRVLNIKHLVEKKSHFLFGPRGTGKSSLLKHDLGHQALIIDLLHFETYIKLISNPSQLEAIIELNPKPFIVIDEIQRVPELLNTDFHSIENRNN